MSLGLGLGLGLGGLVFGTPGPLGAFWAPRGPRPWAWAPPRSQKAYEFRGGLVGPGAQGNLS